MRCWGEGWKGRQSGGGVDFQHWVLLLSIGKPLLWETQPQAGPKSLPVEWLGHGPPWGAGRQPSAWFKKKKKHQRQSQSNQGCWQPQSEPYGLLHSLHKLVFGTEQNKRI